jgi:hypothetical protein
MWLSNNHLSVIIVLNKIIYLIGWVIIRHKNIKVMNNKKYKRKWKIVVLDHLFRAKIRGKVLIIVKVIIGKVIVISIIIMYITTIILLIMKMKMKI